MAAHDTGTLMAQNVVTVYDIVVALLREELLKLRPPRLDWREIVEHIREKIPRYDEFIQWFRAIFARNRPQALLGRDALFADELQHFGSEERLTDFLDDDLDDVRSTGNSTICTTSNDKRMAEMEVQLAELRLMVAALQNQKAIPDCIPSPPPDPTKTSTPLTGGVPPISKNAPPPPPPPPLNFKFFSSRGSTANQSGDSETNTPLKLAPPLANLSSVADENKENMDELPRPKPLGSGDSLMSEISAAMVKRRQKIVNGGYMNALNDLEKPKNRNNNPAIAGLLSTIAPPRAADTDDSNASECSETNDDDWN